jgi:pimeloyl-ACP methyl ester carboxylesterase
MATVSRRRLLQSALESAALAPSIVRGQAQPKKAVLFIPGIMGSSFRVGTREVWSRDVLELWHTLVRNPPLLALPEATATAILDLAVIPAWRDRDYYQKILHIHHKIPTLQAAVMSPFSYDWRQDFGLILQRFEEKLRSEFGVHYEDGRARRQTEWEFYVMGHSMGALVALLAAHRRLIHPENIRKLILIAPPLAGSPEIFRFTFNGVPLIDEYVKHLVECFMWGIFSKEDNLHDVIAARQCTYNLTPPKAVDFLSLPGRSGGSSGRMRTNPFRDGAVAQPFDTTAQRNHLEIREALLGLPQKLKKDDVHLLYGDNRPTPEIYDVRRTTRPDGRQSYTLMGVLDPAPGDGSVTVRSACYLHDPGVNVDSLLTKAPFSDIEHATICEDSKVHEYLEGVLSSR